MYLRFVWLAINEESRVPTGVFHAASTLLDDHDVTPEDIERVEALFAWFNRHLRVPRVTVRSRRPWRRPERAVCWFRPSARDHIARAWELVWILEEYGFTTRMLHTRDPGIVIDEDAHQVFAIPVRDRVRAGQA
jgi:hypothetical protein